MNDASLKTNIEAEPTDFGNTKEIFETIVKIKTMSEEADPASDCSILPDLEDFIDQSFQNMEVLSQGVNDNTLVVQTIESSSPDDLEKKYPLRINLPSKSTLQKVNNLLI